MLDPALLRDHPDVVRTALQNRGVDLSAELDDLATLESQRRRLLPEMEGLQREQNAAAADVAKAKKQGQDTTALQEANRERAQRIKQLAGELETVEQRRLRGMLMI